MWTLTFLIFLSIVLGIGAWLFFLWSVKSGQYDDVEGPKYRMLDDDDEEEEEEEDKGEKALMTKRHEQ
jgi:cbb3-type cytochrome oxidase maturation protein